MSLPNEKRCTQCKEIKPIEQFGRFFDRKTGAELRKWECKECGNSRKRAIYAKNPQPIREGNKRSYEKHKESRTAKSRMNRTINGDHIRELERAPERRARRNQRRRLQRQEHPELIRTKDQQRYQRNPEPKKRSAHKWYQRNQVRALRNHKQWLTNNPVVAKFHRQTSKQRYRARLTQTVFVETIDLDILGARDNWKCHLCHKHVKRLDATADHLIPVSSLGETSYMNVALAHRRCNSRRNKGYLPAQLRLFGLPSDLLGA